jgi:RNA 2',3'-cyclic 3'-phosphodiesterase
VTRRIFLAVPSPPEIHEYLRILKEKNQNIQGIKWMKDHNLHLTIYFLGNIESDSFDDIVQLLTPLINSTKKISFQFDEICFAPTEKPKMIWAKFHRDSAFTELSEAIRKTLQPLIPPTKFHFKEPVPHITLARFHPIKNLSSSIFPEFNEQLTIPVTSIQIFESISTPTGVRYDNLGSFFYLSE